MAKTTDQTTATESPAVTEKRYRVIINSEARPGGDSRVTLVLNGKVTSIARDKEVLLTEGQIEVLRNAQNRGYEISDSGEMKTVEGRRRFPYSVLGEATEPVATAAASETEGNAAS